MFIAIAQVVVIAGLSDKAGFIEERIEDVLQDIEDDVLDEFKDGNFRITIEDGEDKIEINSSVKRELRDKLDRLEDLEDEDDTVSVDISVKIDTSAEKK